MRLGSVNAHGIDVKTTVKHERYLMEDHTSNCIIIDGRIRLFVDGRDNEAEDNLLGFLDRMHAIRNALLQDIADRAGVTE